MEIQTVKIQGSGWLLNNVMHVPGNAPGNREYELIKEWLKDNTPEPEFTEAELAQQVINAKVQEARAYLISTAWYIERLNDPSSGKAIPQEVLDKRAEARVIINELEG